MSNIKVKCNLDEISYTRNNEIKLSFMVNNANTTSNDKMVENLENLSKNAKNGLEINIDRFYEKRSLDFNAYMWQLLDKLAGILITTKEELYKEFIYRVGYFEDIPLPNDKLEESKEIWEANGHGWLFEVIRPSKMEDYTLVRRYYGSSCYNTKQMSKLVNEIVEEAKDNGIQTITPKQILEMEQQYEKYYARR